MKTFNEFWTTLEPQQKQRLADRADTSMMYLSHIAHGHRQPGRAMIKKLLDADKRIKVGMFI